MRNNGSSWFVGLDFLRESSATSNVNVTIDIVPDAARQRSAVPRHDDLPNGRQEIISMHFRRNVGSLASRRCQDAISMRHL